MESVTIDALTRAAIAVLALATVVGAVGIVRRDNSIVDAFWGMMFVVAAFAAASAVPSEDRGALTVLVLTLIVVWAMRLSGHIALRRRHHSGEDWRYARWREQWGPRRALVRSIFQVYLLQATLAFVCSAAVFVVLVSDTQQITPVVIVGAAIWLIGFVFEVSADLQLSRFVARKRAGEISGLLTTGLWGLSRHPNYFGESVAWWGISIIALGASYGWLGMISGALVTILVRYVSGVPLLEQSWKSRPGFDEWAERTPIFVPRIFSS